ncbi:MAG: hypothetical protein ACREA8_08880 [Nitrosotalea sp.]
MEIMLQRQRSRNYNGATYYKHRITIPIEIIRVLRLEDGKHSLDIKLKNKTIIITKTD